MKDTKYECWTHGWRNDTQACPYCMVLVLQDDVKKLKADLDAAILAERARCAEVCRDLKKRHRTDGYAFAALDLAEQRIKEGK